MSASGTGLLLLAGTGFDAASERRSEPKLVRHDAEVALYDLAQDPHERADLLASQPAEVKRLRALYDAWEDGMRPPAWQRGRIPFVRWRDEPVSGP